MTTLDPAKLASFRRGERESPQFFSKFGRAPELRGCKVLDVGCGLGSLSLYIAAQRARSVIGIDINEEVVEFAAENLAKNYPQFNQVCEFRCTDISALPEHDFDIIVSKDTFEHIIGLETCLQNIAERLKLGGRLFLGFGPLYNSVFGDHGWTGVPRVIPWGHVIIPKKILIRILNRDPELRMVW